MGSIGARMTTAERLREEGRVEGEAKGLKQGRQEGREEERALMLIDLMQVSFGPLPPEIESRILATEDVQRLRRWLRRVLAATRPEDVFTVEPG